MTRKNCHETKKRVIFFESAMRGQDMAGFMRLFPIMQSLVMHFTISLAVSPRDDGSSGAHRSHHPLCLSLITSCTEFMRLVAI